MSEEHKRAISAALKGKRPKNWESIHTPAVYAKIAAAHRGKTPANFKAIQPLAWASLRGKPLPPEQRRHISEAKRDAKSHLWKGGVTPVHQSLRHSVEYKLWRDAVYTRDDYRCQTCGSRGKGTILNADHIKPFALFPELRFDITNGRTLCVPCHQKTDTYPANLSPFKK